MIAINYNSIQNYILLSTRLSFSLQFAVAVKQNKYVGKQIYLHILVIDTAICYPLLIFKIDN